MIELGISGMASSIVSYSVVDGKGLWVFWIKQTPTRPNMLTGTIAVDTSAKVRITIKLVMKRISPVPL